MYIVARHYETAPESVDEVLRRVQNEFVPMVGKAPGFVDYYCMGSTEMGRGTITSISTFQNKQGADESTRLASGWVSDRLSNLAPNPPEIIAGEAPVHAKSAVY